MHGARFLGVAGVVLLLPVGAFAQALHPRNERLSAGTPVLRPTDEDLSAGTPERAAADAPLPDIRQLMHEVAEHQKALEKIRENYTYTSEQTIEDIDADGRVKKTETLEGQDFFVNGHIIERMVKKDGRALSPREEQKETERVTKQVEKAERTPPNQPLEGPSVTISRLLEIMDVRNPRRVIYRGRPTIVFDFVGRKDAKTHGLVENASKKVQGTMWIDEADRQVAHLEASFNANFRVAGGLLATVEKGSSFEFDQARVPAPKGDDRGKGDELWLPTGAEATVAARVLLVKGMRQHFIERDFDYKRFQVEAGQGKTAQVVTP
jgi:hypothetical protein